MLPLKAPLKAHEWNSFPQSWFVPGNWFFNVINPNWGNNAEASSSIGIRVPRLQLLGPAHLELQPSSNGTGIDILNTHQITEENEVVNPGTSQQLQHSPDEHLAPTGEALQVDPQHNVGKTGQSTSETEDGLLSIVPLVEGMDEQNDSADAISGSVLLLVSGIHPGYSCKEGRRRTPTRIPL
jgi:hypothetical protein